MVVKTVTDA